MKAKIFTLLIIMTLVTCGMAYSQSISLESVDGLLNPPEDMVMTADGATTITFNLRLTNGATDAGGIANGFRIYSDDGATWGATVPDTFNLGWPLMFDLVYQIFELNVDGAMADTVGFAGSKFMSGSGLPANFDEIGYKITIGPLSATDDGKTICLDSSYYPPAGSWKWTPDTRPAWAGPFCFWVGVKDDVKAIGVDGLPTDFALNQNYPNPFNPVTNFKFDLPVKSKVSIQVFNVLGQTVKNLVDEEMDAGSYLVDWDGSSDSGDKVSSGVYFYKMTAGDFTDTKKMMMLK